MNLHRFLFLTNHRHDAALWLTNMRAPQTKFSVTVANPCTRSIRATRRFDLIMIDVDNERKAEALELCKSLRKRTLAPILFVTSQVDDEYEVQVYNVGADDFIVKPIGVELLQAKLQAWQRWIVPTMIGS